MRRLVVGLFCAAAVARPAITPATVTKAREILVKGVNEKHADSRIQALKAVGMMGHDDGMMKGLVVRLEDKDVQVRIAAINALADLKDPSAVPALKNRMDSDETPEVTFAAAKALWALNDADGKAELEAVLSREEKATSGQMRSQMRKMVRQLKTPKSALILALRGGSFLIPVPGAGSGVAAMFDLLSDPELSARATVLVLLGTEKTDEVRKLLAEALNDADWSVRAAAVQMIAISQRTELSDGVGSLLNDKKEKVRYRAAAAYLRLATADGEQSSLRASELRGAN
jgi:HEAT repeat protein